NAALSMSSFVVKGPTLRRTPSRGEAERSHARGRAVKPRAYGDEGTALEPVRTDFLVNEAGGIDPGAAKPDRFDLRSPIQDQPVGARRPEHRLAACEGDPGEAPSVRV